MIKQGTQEWLLERCGCVTASNLSAVLAQGSGLTRSKYLERVIAERINEAPMETYTNGHMERGREQEDYAKVAYIAKYGIDIQEVGFIKHPALLAGASPDGLIGEDGGIEIKSVIQTVQIKTIKRKDVPPEHKAQIQGNLWITGRQWWDFVSFCDDMKDEADRLFVKRVYRDEDYIRNTLEPKVQEFLADVEKGVAEFLAAKAEIQTREWAQCMKQN